MRIENDLGAVIKASRMNKGLTQEQLAEIAGVGLRHIVSIENEGGYPSYEVLYNMIRKLNIPSDSIFYPETQHQDSKLQYLTRLLGQCSGRDIHGVTALVEALLDKPEVDVNN